ncbi:hypothetical protein [Nonomuraea jabiensis]|uniref:Uncharacterized protein n=1 Tax=Nonomuraea jabiensis TaxID=882448 RepID=A0A7W9GBK0_9ACTN|nr:hypothetical protein [Nonomuraea jabiensis]MBB5780774.1 hypothetical protein [Nonomuraea jabiensis]
MRRRGRELGDRFEERADEQHGREDRPRHASPSTAPTAAMLVKMPAPAAWAPAVPRAPAGGAAARMARRRNIG